MTYGNLSQNTGPSRAIWATPVKLVCVAARKPRVTIERFWTRATLATHRAEYRPERGVLRLKLLLRRAPRGVLPKRIEVET